MNKKSIIICFLIILVLVVVFFVLFNQKANQNSNMNNESTENTEVTEMEKETVTVESFEGDVNSPYRDESTENLLVSLSPLLQPLVKEEKYYYIPMEIINRMEIGANYRMLVAFVDQEENVVKSYDFSTGLLEANKPYLLNIALSMTEEEYETIKDCEARIVKVDSI